MKPRYLAAIDLLLAEAKGTDWKVIRKEKEAVRLGGGGIEFLNENAIERGIRTLKLFSKVIGEYKASVRAVGTVALRDAKNGPVFLERASRECGIQVELITGITEAHLSYQGVQGALPVQDKRILLIDLGGGSTEFLIGNQGMVEFVTSLPWGAVRITDRFFSKEPLTPEMFSECREFLQKPLKEIREQAGSFDLAVGVSGTVRSLYNLLHVGEEPISMPFTVREIEDLIEKVVSIPTTDERKRLPGLDEKRADIIVGGSVLLREIIRTFGIKNIHGSQWALREGMILSMAGRTGKQ